MHSLKILYIALLCGLCSCLGWALLELQQTQTTLQDTQRALSLAQQELNQGFDTLTTARTTLHENLQQLESPPPAHKSLFASPYLHTIPLATKKWHGKQLFYWGPQLQGPDPVMNLLTPPYPSPSMLGQGLWIQQELEQMRQFFAIMVEKSDALHRWESTLPTLVPASGRLSDRFGMRKKHPITGARVKHKGIDIAAIKGTPFYAAASGTVIFAGTQKSYGKMVLIDHHNGLRTRYAHAHSLHVKKWQKVHKSDLIGKIGSTGRAKGPHLHFELICNLEPIDPLPFLRDLPPPTSTPALLASTAG
ncbi:MAG: M23 family metallopeptidase [Zetaproteobacteria bacterium]|nr:M23 family metallopeptidase [Zetaproteobacteria bacterium]